MERISVIGCGWLGLPLAAELAEAGYTVKGSVRSEERFPELIARGILPYVFNLAEPVPEETKKGLFNTDAAVVCIPPIKDKPAENLYGFARLSARLAKAGVEKVILVSSTSVYPDLNRVVSETDAVATPSAHSGTAMLDIEKAFTSQERQAVILRFGGLFGPNRLPGRFLSAQMEVKGGDAPVNMVHLDDCISSIRFGLEQLEGGAYNVVSPVHPSKKEFYSAAATIAGMEAPVFIAGKEPYKEVSPAKIMEAGFGFKYANPIDALKV